MMVVEINCQLSFLEKDFLWNEDKENAKNHELSTEVYNLLPHVRYLKILNQHRLLRQKSFRKQVFKSMYSYV